jgi:D-lactate dehydrogenase
MRVAVYSTKPYTQRFLEATNEKYGHDLHFLEARLDPRTARLAEGCGAVCAFVNDDVSAPVIEALAKEGVKTISMRCAGVNNVDIDAATEHGLCVTRVPAYSPNAVAEHALALMLSLNRKIARARDRVREGNFELQGLLGFDMAGKTVGVFGTGKIGTVVVKILRGIGCEVLAYDLYPNDEVKDLGGTYVELDELFERSDIVTLHCPLTPDTQHVINAEALGKMKRGVMLINTSRGRLIDTKAAIEALKSEHLGYLGIDVYEEEGELFFSDLSDQVIQDDVFARLLTFPNVIITGHQAFFTKEALDAIADTTLDNIARVEAGEECPNAVTKEHVTG